MGLCGVAKHFAGFECFLVSRENPFSSMQVTYTVKTIGLPCMIQYCVATPIVSNVELVGQPDHAITDHEYPPTVWAAGGVLLEHMQISAAKRQPASYAVWIGMYASVTRMRAAVRAGHDRLLHNAGVDAEPILEVEFDQRLGW